MSWVVWRSLVVVRMLRPVLPDGGWTGGDDKVDRTLPAICGGAEVLAKDCGCGRGDAQRRLRPDGRGHPRRRRRKIFREGYEPDPLRAGPNPAEFRLAIAISVPRCPVLRGASEVKPFFAG